MRAFLASSIGVTATAALLLPLTPASTLTASSTSHSEPGMSGTAAAAGANGGAPDARAAGNRQLPGHTQSLTLGGSKAGTRAADNGQVDLAPQKVHPFSLVGAVWDRPDSELHGRVQIRTHDAHGTGWSDWQDMETHSEDRPDTAAAETQDTEARGSTAPMWVGGSDGVQARVQPEEGLPEGLRLELVDPGPEPAGHPGQAGKSGAAAPGSAGSGSRNSGSREATEAGRQAGVLPPLSKAQTQAEYPSVPESGNASGAGGNGAPDPAGAQSGVRPASAGSGSGGERAAGPIGPRPGIVTRSGWGADEGMREGDFQYTNTVRTAFVHHTAMSNNYKCSEVPSILRSIYRYHVKSSKWRDIGYNFLVDKCGKIYEGRAGGVAKAVQGAHTYGFNSNSMGVAVLGSFDKASPSKASVDAVSKLTAWKLGLFGVNPSGATRLTSGGGKFKKGTTVRMNNIAGHRDGFDTSCPGAKLYDKLGTIRSTASHLQGR